MLSATNTRSEIAERERHYLEHDVEIYVEIDLDGVVAHVDGESAIVDDLRAAFS